MRLLFIVCWQEDQEACHGHQHTLQMAMPCNRCHRISQVNPYPITYSRATERGTIFTRSPTPAQLKSTSSVYIPRLERHWCSMLQELRMQEHCKTRSFVDFIALYISTSSKLIFCYVAIIFLFLFSFKTLHADYLYLG